MKRAAIAVAALLLAGGYLWLRRLLLDADLAQLDAEAPEPQEDSPARRIASTSPDLGRADRYDLVWPEDRTTLTWRH